jgi:hypothetical protein
MKSRRIKPLRHAGNWIQEEYVSVCVLHKILKGRDQLADLSVEGIETEQNTVNLWQDISRLVVIRPEYPVSRISPHIVTATQSSSTQNVCLWVLQRTFQLFWSYPRASPWNRTWKQELPSTKSPRLARRARQQLTWFGYLLQVTPTFWSAETAERCLLIYKIFWTTRKLTASFASRANATRLMAWRLVSRLK